MEPTQMSPDGDARDGTLDGNDAAFVMSIVEEGQLVRVTARGDVDVESVTAFHDGLHTAVAGGSAAVRIDLAQVTFLGSEGIRTLVLLHESAAAQGTRITVSDASPIVRRVLTLTESDWLLGD
jgi:anti-sigma B factor antagonist